MAEPHVLSVLVSKRSELAGEIDGLERQADQLRTDLLHIDAAIRIFAPDYRRTRFVPRPNVRRASGSRTAS